MLGFEGFGGLKDYGALGVWGFKDIGPGRMPQPARSLACLDAPAISFFWLEPPS